ncbi:MAG: O-antigen ligase family protein [Actinomycetota bacterium]
MTALHDPGRVAAPDPHLPEHEAAEPEPWRLRFPRFDAVTLTVIFAFFAFLIPARYTYAGIGAAGRPGILLGIALLFWWGITRAIPSMSFRRANPVRQAALGFFVVFLMAYAGGLSRALPGVESRAMDRSLIITASLIGVTLVVTDGVKDRARLDRLLSWTVIGGSVMALLGHIQFFVGVNLTENFRLPGMSLNRDFFEVEDRNAFTRVNATATHPIEFGVLMGMLLPVAIHYALHARTTNQKIVHWTATALIATAGPMSVSRSSIVAIGAGILVLAIGWDRRTRRRALMLSVPALIAFSSAVPGLLGTIRGLFAAWGSDSSIQYRTNDYDLIFEFVSERPLFGRGPGTFLPENYFVVDNQYLITLVTTGIVGFLGLIGFVGIAALSLILIRRRVDDAETRHLALALLASYASAAAASVTYDSLALAYSIFASVLFLLIGAAGALWRVEQHRWDPRAERREVAPR